MNSTERQLLVIEVEGTLPALNRPILIAAFEGWNDAGDAATAAIDHLQHVWQTHYLGAINPEDYYDFQVNRPHVVVEPEEFDYDEQYDGHPGQPMTHMDLRDSAPRTGQRLLIWPTTTFTYAQNNGNDPDFIVVRGVEPNMRWRTFCEEIITLAQRCNASMVITLGALLADIAHTRPVPVTCTTNNVKLTHLYKAELSHYEGPTGIVGVLQAMCHNQGIDHLALWSSVPHYVAHPPSPKATVALIRRLEDVLDVAIPHSELAEDCRAWQRGVDEIAEEDSEIAEYIQTLEESTDPSEIPEASGEAIAQEFEKYLRRRHTKPGDKPPPGPSEL